MATVDKYILQGSTLAVDQSGISAVLVFLVSSLSGDKPNLPYLAYQESEIPKRGDPHPTIPNLQADTVAVAMNDANKALITVTYRQLSGFKLNINDTEPCQIEIGSSVVEIETPFDVNGEEILLTHTAYDVSPGVAATATAAAIPAGSPIPRIIGPQQGKIKKQVPILSARFSRRERSAPLEKSLEYTGTVNGGTFLGGAARTWLCRAINGVSDDGGLSYRVSYEFQYSSERYGWDAIAIATDPTKNNEPVVKPIWDKGIKRVYTYLQKSFENLNLGYK